MSPQAHAFCKRFFPDASRSEWNNWRWQLQNRIKDMQTLARVVHYAYPDPGGTLGLCTPESRP